MSITVILTLIRDLAILGALGYILWFIHHADQNAVKVKDLQAVTQQLEANAKTVSQWAEEARNAENTRKSEMDQVSRSIAAQHAPIVLRFPEGSGPVSNPSPTSPGRSACSGGNDAGAGIDIRPKVNAFELKYEAGFAACRSLLRQWPK